MTQPEQPRQLDPLERLIQDFTSDDRSDFSIVGRMTAVRSGATAIRGLLKAHEELPNRDPQVTAAAIQAIGTLVGSYIEALGERRLSGRLDVDERGTHTVSGGIRVNAKLHFPEPPPQEPPEPAMVPSR